MCSSHSTTDIMRCVTTATRSKLGQQQFSKRKFIFKKSQNDNESLMAKATNEQNQMEWIEIKERRSNEMKRTENESGKWDLRQHTRLKTRDSTQSSQHTRPACQCAIIVLAAFNWQQPFFLFISCIPSLFNDWKTQFSASLFNFHFSHDHIVNENMSMSANISE